MERKEMKMRKYSGKGTSARRGKRWFALFLCLCLIGTTVPITARAEESGSTTAGLCEHHPQHTADCGYEAPVEAHECEHEHNDECGYQEAGDCNHVHTEECGEDGENCTHVHDDECGYAEGHEC